MLDLVSTAQSRSQLLAWRSELALIIPVSFQHLEYATKSMRAKHVCDQHVPSSAAAAVRPLPLYPDRYRHSFSPRISIQTPNTNKMKLAVAALLATSAAAFAPVSFLLNKAEVTHNMLGMELSMGRLHCSVVARKAAPVK